MVRNWQARVEQADTRRKEAKHRKAKSEEKRQYKQWASDLGDVLDRNREALLQSYYQQQQQRNNTANDEGTSSSNGDGKAIRWKLSLWTDVPPTGAEDEDDFDEGDKREAKGERKKRSKSFGDGGIVNTEDDTFDSPSNGRIKGKKGGRGRSSSVSESPTPAPIGKKKIHPRSGKDQQQAESEDAATGGAAGSSSQVWMCRSHFFVGLCDRASVGGGGGGGRNSNSGGCRYVHTSNGKKDSSSLSLYDVLYLQNKPKQQPSSVATAATPTNHAFHRTTSLTDGDAQLKLSEKAELEAANAEPGSSERVGAMEMVYYIEVWLDPESTKPLDEPDDNDAVEQPSKSLLLLLSDQMTQALSKCNLYLASVVYVALDGVLVFDRYRNGSLFTSDRDFLTAIVGPDNAATSRRERNDAEAAETVRTIPGPVLAQILAFLPDTAVAAAARVCRAWHVEISQNLPNVWRHLLDRHEWPHPLEHDNVKTHSNHDTDDADSNHKWTLPDYASQFQRHYTVIRDMKALQKGLHAICDVRSAGSGSGSSSDNGTPSEMAYQEFASRKHAPSQPNTCVGLQEWSPNQLLVAYQVDCTLRLFQTVARPNSAEKVCRELICQRIDPYRNTKKRNCRIVALGLDELYVASLCHVTGTVGSDADVEAYVLVVMSRDDFLLGESSGAAESNASDDIMEKLRVIDVGESVLNYLVAAHDGDPKLVDLFDFIAQGGDVGEVEILASQTLATCGYGRFMVEVSISIPVEDDIDETITMQLIDRKLVLFSASAGAIVWAGESCLPSDHLAPRRNDMTMSYLRRPNVEGGSRAACYFAVTSSATPAIMVGDIEPSGEVQSVHLLEPSLLCWATPTVLFEDEPGQWETVQTGLRPLLVTSTDVVVSDVWVRRQGDVIVDRKCILSFCARWPTASTNDYISVVISGNIEVVRMSCIREHHIVLVCRQFKSPPVTVDTSADDVDAVDRTLNGIAGHWFGDDNDDDDNQQQDVNQGQPVGGAAPAGPAAAGAAPTTEAPARMTITAVVVHVPSRHEIGRLRLLEGQAPDALLPHLVLDCDETVGLGCSWEGVVMTGHDIRSSTQMNDDDMQSAKKKKKKTVNKSFKNTFRTHHGK